MITIAKCNAGEGEAAAEAINARGGKAKFIRTDVTSEECVRESVDNASPP